MREDTMFSRFEKLPPERKAELEQRRQRIAEPPPIARSDDCESYLVVQAGREQFGLPLAYVSETERLSTLAPLPGMPSHVIGLTTIRGDVLPVIDIRVFFDLPRPDLTDLPLAAVLEGAMGRIAIVIDDVVTLLAITPDEILAPISSHTGLRHDYQIGVTADRCVILNLDRILSDPRLVIDQPE